MKPQWQNIEPSPYALLLEKDEWKEKRDHIVSRDENKCQKCQNETYLNNIDLKISISLKNTISDKGNFLILENFQSNSSIARKLPFNKENFKHQFNGIISFCLINENNHIIAVFQEKSLELKTYMKSKRKEIKNEISKEIFEDVVLNKLNKFFNLHEYKTHLLQHCNLISWQHTKYLNVHHKFYQKGKKPWKYDDDALVTLCGACHQKTHEEETIYLHNENGKKIILTPCDRCDGTGVKPEYHYVENGICFKCRGSRFIEELI